MRKILSLALCAALLLPLPACAAKQDELENPYRCTSIQYESFDQDGNANGTQTYEFLYFECDTDLHTTQITYNDGVKVMEESYERDAYGNVIGITTTENGETNIYRNTLTLDENHLPTRIESYSGDDLNSITEYTYDEYGNKTFSRYTTLEDGEVTEVIEEEYTYDQDGNVTQRSVPFHDWYYQMSYSDGLLVYLASTDENGNIKTYKEYLYDDQGREIQCSEYNGTGNLKETTKHTYDETGLKKETQTYSAIGKPSSSKVLFTFDIYGNVLTRELHTQNKLGEWSVFNRTTYTYEPIPTT